MSAGFEIVPRACQGIGIEVDGYPGIKTARSLEASGLPYSGADPAFYELTTPKTLL